jgi:hypothetical protein
VLQLERRQETPRRRGRHQGCRWPEPSPGA